MSEPVTKKSKSSYNHKWKYHQTRKHCLENGLRGFLCSTNFSEKLCIGEAYDLLNAYADKLYPLETNIEIDKTIPSEDIADELDNEIQNIKIEAKNTCRRFQATDTGVKNLVFIKTILDDPTELATTIANEILETKEQKTKNLLRLVPIQFVCKANVSNVIENIRPLLSKYLNNEKKTFAVVLNRRFNNTIDRDGLISEVAKLVGVINPEYKVDLKNPNIIILLEIIKSWCLISISFDYYRLKKYNLVELSIQKDSVSQTE